MRRRAPIAGIVGALVMSAMFLLARAAAGVPTPSELFADTLAPLLPVDLFGVLIGLARGYTPLKIIGFSSTVLAQIAVGGLGALALARRERPLAAFALAVAALYALTAAAFWPVFDTQYHGVPAGRARVESLAFYALAFGLYFAVTVLCARGSTATTPSGGPSRGAFLERAVAAASLLIGGASWAAIFRRATFSYDGTQVLGEDVSLLTPAEKFYCVTKNVADPMIDPALWRLRVEGAVASPFTLDLAGLTRRAAVRQETTLMCINNEPGGGLMSNALWTGVPLRDPLGEAHALDGVRRVALHAADNYVDTIPLAKALDPATLVAWQMNGDALIPKHGAPVRMIVPGVFGEKNVKWLTRIELLREDRKGFYERQGWGPSFVIPTHSRIDVPAANATVRAGTSVELHGVAFAGDRGVTRVEVTTDGGATWRDARLVTPFRRVAWRLWSFDWRPAQAGAYVLSVRATDGTGAVQTSLQRPAAPQGATGLHRIAVGVA